MMLRHQTTSLYGVNGYISSSQKRISGKHITKYDENQSFREEDSYINEVWKHNKFHCPGD